MPVTVEGFFAFGTYEMFDTPMFAWNSKSKFNKVRNPDSELNNYQVQWPHVLRWDVDKPHKWESPSWNNTSSNTIHSTHWPCIQVGFWLRLRLTSILCCIPYNWNGRDGRLRLWIWVDHHQWPIGIFGTCISLRNWLSLCHYIHDIKRDLNKKSVL